RARRGARAGGYGERTRRRGQPLGTEPGHPRRGPAPARGSSRIGDHRGLHGPGRDPGHDAARTAGIAAHSGRRRHGSVARPARRPRSPRLRPARRDPGPAHRRAAHGRPHNPARPRGNRPLSRPTRPPRATRDRRDPSPPTLMRPTLECPVTTSPLNPAASPARTGRPAVGWRFVAAFVLGQLGLWTALLTPVTV